MTEPALSVGAQSWLREVERRLSALPPDQRAETLAGLIAHLTDAIDSGANEAQALTRLGSPAQVAEAAFQEYQQQTGVDARWDYWTARRVVQIVATAFALAAAFLAAFGPAYSSVTETVDEAGQTTTQATSATLVEVNGAWVLIVLAVPVLLAAMPLGATGRWWQPLSIASAVLLIIVVVVGSLSIGWFYIPAMIAAIVAVFLPTRSGAARARTRASPSP